MTPCFCVFMYSNSINSCHKIKGQISYHNESKQKFDTILFVSSCLQISEIPVTIKGQISYHNESNQKFWHHTFCVFMSLLSFDFSWSFSKKTRGNHWLQCTPLKLIYFLTFDEASAKNWKKTFHESSVKKYMKSLMSLIVCHNVFFSFWFVLEFSWSFSKKLEEIFNGISMPRLGYKVLLSNWLFLIFSWSYSKKLEEIFICILM